MGLYADKGLFSNPGSRFTRPSFNPIFWTVDFRTLPVGAQIGLPNNLNFSRAANSQGNSETVQISPNAVITTGLTTNVPRIGQTGTDSTTRGLVLEESRNSLVDSRNISPAGSGWIHGNNCTSTTNAAAGPDGSILATEENLTVANSSTSPLQGATATAVLACWVRSTSGGSARHDQVIANLNGSLVVHAGADIDGTWRRYSCFPGAGIQGVFGYPEVNDTGHGGGTWGTGGVSGVTRDVLIDLVECVGGLSNYPTETILGTNGSTRQGERLWLTTTGDILDTGRLSLEIKMIPKADATLYDQTGGANIYLWFKDNNNFVKMINSTRQLSVTINGSTWTPSTALNWTAGGHNTEYAAGDIVDFWIEAGGGVLQSKISYRINGGTEISLGSSPSPQAVISSVGTFDFFSNNATGIFSAWHQVISAYFSGFKPSWVA